MGKIAVLVEEENDDHRLCLKSRLFDWHLLGATHCLRLVANKATCHLHER